LCVYFSGIRLDGSRLHRRLSAHFRQFLRQIYILPIAPEIARAATRLDFSFDPAEEIIAATNASWRKSACSRPANPQVATGPAREVAVNLQLSANNSRSLKADG